MLIRGGRVYDHDGDVHQPPVADIRIDRDCIVAVAPNLAPKAGEAVIDARNKLVIPGFVNAHYHSHDVLAKGLIEELPLEAWMLYSKMPDQATRSAEEVRTRTLLGAYECLRNGITTLQDMNNRQPLDETYLDVVLKAYADIGIRVVFSSAIQDLAPADATPFWREMLPADVLAAVGGQANDWRSQVDFVEAQIQRVGRSRPRLHWALGPSGPQRCSRDMLAAVADLSARLNLPVYTHVNETKAQAVQGRLAYGRHGGSLVRFMGEAGLLGPRVNLVHGVWLSRDEIELLGETGSGLVHNPLSNLKLKSGMAPILELRKAGVRLAHGCDNCSAGDTQNLFQAMKMYCLLPAVTNPMPNDLNAAEAMRVATLGGARSALLENEIGALKPGMKADLALLDLNDPALMPLNSAARQLVYSECGRSVETVIVDGRVVIKDRRLETVNEEDLRRAVAEVSETFRRDYERLKLANARLCPHLIEAHRAAWKEDIGIHRFVGPFDDRF